MELDQYLTDLKNELYKEFEKMLYRKEKQGYGERPSAYCKRIESKARRMSGDIIREIVRMRKKWKKQGATGVIDLDLYMDLKKHEKQDIELKKRLYPNLMW